MKKKALFYCRVNRDDCANAGVIKKCRGQVKGLRQLGWEVDMVWLCNEGALLNEELVYQFKKSMKPHSLSMYFFYYFRWHRVLKRMLALGSYEFCYARYELSHPGLLSFFKKIKKEKPATRLVLEIPTYPYAKEMKGGLRKIQLLLDWLYRGRLKKYVTLVVGFGAENEIFGMEALSIANGIDLDGIPVSNAKPEPGVIRLIAVGYWHYWHGLDRLVEGLAAYYKEDAEKEFIVKLTIIGEGLETHALKDLVLKYALNELVIFKLPLLGEGLIQMFEYADIGVGSLGLHRIGLTSASPLKNREYCARGLPFILSTHDWDFPQDLLWVKYFPPKDYPVPIEELISFYKDLNQRRKEHEVRDFAEKNFSWRRRLSIVVEKLGVNPGFSKGG